MVVKGVCRGDDARRAAEHGAKAVVVSNHGGRQLDTAPATCEVLPHVVEAAGDLCEIYVDGGIRRGSDVLKAIALGARAVLVGRPVLWGLCVAGEQGALQVLEILRRELDEAMLLCGCTKLSDIRGCWRLTAILRRSSQGGKTPPRKFFLPASNDSGKNCTVVHDPEQKTGQYPPDTFGTSPNTHPTTPRGEKTHETCQ